MAKTIFTRGASSGVDAEPLVDGQLLFDNEGGRILLDCTVDETPTRITVKEGIFKGTTAEWEALTDAQKAVYTYVNLTDDYEPQTGISGHVVKDSTGTAFVQRNSLVFNNATVVDDETNNATIVTPAGGGSGGHTIMDENGTTYAQRSNLVFGNVTIEDDPTNDATIVIATGGGSDISIGDVTGATATQNFDSVVLKWTDPNDIVIEGVTLAAWAGTTVVRKVGSAPASVSDGTVVLTNTTRNQYSSTGYTDSNLEFGTTYYYRFFPYKMSGSAKVYTDGTSLNVTIARTIISTIPSQSGSLTYDSTEQSPTWSNYDSSQLTLGGNTADTNAGTYTATFTPKTGYCWSDSSITAKNVDWTIDKIELTAPAVTDTSKTYNGSAQGPTIASYDTTKISVSGDSATNAGDYTLVFSPVDAVNYEFGSGETTSVAWTIAKANGDATFTKGGAAFDPDNDTIVLEPETLTDTLTIVSSTGIVSSVTSGDTSTVTVSYSGNTITFTSVNESSGNVTVTVAVEASANYNAANVELTVEAKFAQIYGAEWDGSSSSAWSRTDAAEGFTNPSPAVSNGNGSSPFDDILPWSGLKRVTDSEAGTLVEIPKYYYKWTRNGNKMKLQISSAEFDGALVSPAHADRGDGAGERDVVYVGAYHCASSNYKSTSGVQPANNITRANFRTNIHNLGTKVWQYDYAMYWTIMMLYLVEYADWNSQAKIGYGCGNNSATENAGLTDSMTYHTGTNASSRTNYGHTRYRYIEDLWGNVYDWCDGIYFSSANVYCISNPSNFSDNSGGTLVGTRATSGGCISAWTNPSASGFEYALYPSAVVSDSTYSTYVCDLGDYHASGVVLRVGGNYGQGQYHGAFYLDGYNAASVARTNIGSRLQKLP